MKRQCLKRCRLDERVDVCIACGRTLEEITQAGKLNKRRRELNEQNNKENNRLQS